MDNINFKGFKNTVITSVNGKSSTGMIKLKAYRLVTTLTDDAEGTHLDGFYKSLYKAGAKYAWEYVPKDFPEEDLIFDISKFKFEGNKIQPETTFILNGRNLKLDNDKVLPIFSYLAKSIKYLQETTKNVAQKDFAKNMLNIITEEVQKYLG